MVQLEEAIGQRLEYFQELEHATRMLNHPGDSLVLQTDFLYMVERVDVCIDFLKAHVRSFIIPPTNQSFLTYKSRDTTGKPSSTSFVSNNV